MRVSDRVIEIVQDLECHHQGTDLSINGRTLTGVLRDIAKRARVEEDARSSLRAALNGVCGMLGLTERDGLPDMPEVILTELERRLMPEGMEWPRYDTGEPVPLGGEVTVTVHDEGGDFDRTLAIRSIQYKENGVLREGANNEMVLLSHGERVKPRAQDFEYKTGTIAAELLTHECPDSWELLEEDCSKSDVDYCAERGLLEPSCDTVEGDASTRHCSDCGRTCGEKMARDLVRRAKALAGGA